MKASIRSILFFFVLPSIALCQQRSPNWTGGYPNGRLWEILSGDEKALYVEGVFDGVMLLAEQIEPGSAAADSEKTLKEKVEDGVKYLKVTGFTNGEIADVISDFYKDRANIKIPVIWAYVYAMRKMRGDIPSVLEIFVMIQRTLWNDK